ncbi:MJ0042-type zinc finger domain-containing protein, partial [Pseudomonas viridiflava]
MTDSFVTQCPHCQTSFRVSHAQLSVARGVVRCGACLQVFNAARQLLEQRAIDDSEKVALAAVPVIIEQPRAEPRLESEP